MVLNLPLIDPIFCSCVACAVYAEPSHFYAFDGKHSLLPKVHKILIPAVDYRSKNRTKFTLYTFSDAFAADFHLCLMSFS